MEIGYIGLGAMGGALARWLAGSGRLTVWDINQPAVDRMIALGAASVGTAEELARKCDVIFLCLPRTADVRQTIFAEKGLLSGLSAGKIVIDQTSGIPDETNGFARELAARDIAMLDAPVTGGVGGAQAGTVTIIVSGPSEVFDKVSPILGAISPKVFHCSERTGDAQALKLVNNAMSAGYRMSVLEVVAMGRKLGLSLDVLTELFRAGTGANFSTKNMLPAILEGRAATNFALALMVKDMTEVIALARANDAPMPLAGTVRAMMQIGLNTIGKTAMLDDVLPLMETLSGTTIRPAGDEARGAPAPAVAITVGCAGGDAAGLAETISGTEGLRLGSATDLALGAILVAEPSAEALRATLSGLPAEALPAGRIVVAKTVAEPGAIEAIAAELAARGCPLVDLAVSSDLFGAPDGPRVSLVAGPAEAVDKVQPLLDRLAPSAIRCGERPGMGQLARVMDRALAACNAVVTYESAAAGVKVGLGVGALSTILNAGSGWSGVAERLLPALGGAATGHPVEGLAAMTADLRTASALGAACGAPMLITDHVLGIFEAAGNELAADATLLDLAETFERRAETRYSGA